jgi:PAS domain-containing protein
MIPCTGPSVRVEIGCVWQVTTELIDAISFQRAVIESIGVGIIILDKDARIIGANSLALGMINKGVEDVLNRPVRAFSPRMNIRD